MITILYVIAMLASPSVLWAPFWWCRKGEALVCSIPHPCFGASLRCLSCRNTEKEKTAACKSAVTGPTPLPSAERELSNGTDETLRDCSLPWFFLVPTMGALHSKELPLPYIAKFKELATGLISLDKARRLLFFLGGGLTNSLSISALRARLAVVHSFYRKFSKERQEKELSDLCHVVLILFCFFFNCFFFFTRLEEREASLC